MLQIKRWIVYGGLGLHLVSTGCSTSYGGTAAAPSFARGDYAVSGNVAPAKEAPMADGTRSFESVVSVAGGSTDADMWSGGDSDNSFKKDLSIREEAPPPPPAPGFATQNPVPAPAKPMDSKTEQPGTTPTTSGKKGDEQTRTEVASPVHAPMLIYTGRVQMAVYEVRSSLGEVEVLARSMGGFLAKRDDRSITIRVPAARFDEAMRRIEKMGDMLSRDVQVEDVTEEFNDVDIRLKNARAVRDRLEQLLSKAAKVEESIQIEKELERVALTIERLEGRMKFLKDRAAFSTITVIFQPRSAVELSKRPFNLPVPWLYELGLGRLLAL